MARTRLVRAVRVAVVLAVVLVVSLIAGVYAAGQDPQPLSAAGAREVTVRAFTFAGLDDVEVTGEPRAELFDQAAALASEGGDRAQRDAAAASDRLPVWVVPANVSGRPVELYLTRANGQLVNLDDALPGGGFVLTEEQFDRLKEFRLDLAAEQLRKDRQGPAVVAGLLLAVAVVLLLVVGLRGRRQGPDGSAQPPPPAAPPFSG